MIWHNMSILLVMSHENSNIPLYPFLIPLMSHYAIILESLNPINSVQFHIPQREVHRSFSPALDRHLGQRTGATNVDLMFTNHCDLTTCCDMIVIYTTFYPLVNQQWYHHFISFYQREFLQKWMYSMGIKRDPIQWGYVFTQPFFRPYFLGIFPDIPGLKKWQVPPIYRFLKWPQTYILPFGKLTC